MSALLRAEIQVSGLVQGVGFRYLLPGKQARLAG